MTMEIEFLNSNLTEKNPKLLTEHIQRMTSGGAPFFPATLSLVYDKLVERAFPRTIVSGSGLEQSPGTEGQGVTNSTDQTNRPNQGSGSTNRVLNPTSQVSNSTTQVSNSTNQVPGPTHQVANPAFYVNTPSTSTPTVTLPSDLHTTAPTPGPSSAAARVAWLVCVKCGTQSRLQDLYLGLLCPLCPARSGKKKRARMKCQLCGNGLDTRRIDCVVRKCRAIFV